MFISVLLSTHFEGFPRRGETRLLSSHFSLNSVSERKRAMKRPDVPTSVIRFGVFVFDPQSGELRRHGLKVKLERQAAKVLSLLLERAGQMRTREELQHRLWPDNVFVDFDRCLYKAIHTVRRALGDSATTPRYIETVEHEGYCFIPTPLELTGPA